MPRLGLTEGQTYTIAILVVVAVLLISSLTRLQGRVADLISAPGPSVTTTTGPASTASTRPATGTSMSLPRRPVPPDAGAGGADRPTTPARPSTPATPTTVDDGGGTPTEPPCATDDAVQAFRGVIEQLDTLVGGVIPSATLVSALALATGCSQTDPVVLVLATLIEVGEGLPDLGLGFLEFPVLPFLEVPDPLVVLAQPLRPLLDPVCGTVGTVGLLFSQVGPAYPYPLDATFAVSLFYAATTCGQIQGL